MNKKSFTSKLRRLWRQLSMHKRYSLVFTFWVMLLCFFILGVTILYEVELAQTAGAVKERFYPWSNGEEDVSTTPVLSISTKKPFKICLVGDNNLATMPELINPENNVYANVLPTLQACDILIGNLECNVSAPGTGTPQAKGYTYTIGPAAAEMLARAGFDAVSLANNHTMDYGPAALIDEMRILDEAGILHFGGGNNSAEAFTPKYLVFNDTKIAFLSYNTIEYWITSAQSNRAGTAYFDYNWIVNGIQEARAKADLVIVFPHWGEENKTQYNNLQKYWAHVFIDNGADLVVGSGPHVRQETEVYNGKNIYYSIGNFAVRGFDWLPEATIGSLLEVQVTGPQITSMNTKTVHITSSGSPELTE